MDVHIIGQRAVSQEDAEHARQRLGHLTKFLSTITSIEVVLETDGKPRDGKGSVANVTVATSGPAFHSKVVSTDFRSAVDIAYERLERQLKEFKRKRSGRPAHHSRPPDQPPK